MQHFNGDFYVYYKYTTCFGSYRPSSGVDNTLFIYANILKAMAIGYFFISTQITCCNGGEIYTKYVKNIYKLF
jgi:hypothetical protein